MLNSCIDYVTETKNAKPSQSATHTEANATVSSQVLLHVSSVRQQTFSM